ncbi:hypothetical protein ACH5RR_007567 [Cinchona calisaya]|uniref:Uncharacterized protein n=1 Tax=Cinchona calisaya TaxID=153742 RepID=A0ABD3AS78_9GENT
MAFGQWQRSNYVRIQGNGLTIGNHKRSKINRDGKKDVVIITEKMLSQKNVESMLFKGKKLAERSNLEKLEYFGGELIKEQEWRKSSSCVLPPVFIYKHYSSSSSSSSSSPLDRHLPLLYQPFLPLVNYVLILY